MIKYINTDLVLLSILRTCLPAGRDGIDEVKPIIEKYINALAILKVARAVLN